MIKIRTLVFAAILFGTCLGHEMLANDRPCGPSSRQGPLSKLIPQGAFGADFRPACRQHDHCYATAEVSRKQCDKDFVCNMVNACECSSHPRLCKRRARTMYRMVRLFGNSSYDPAND